MDSITQGLLGAAIAEAGFRRRLGGRAVAYGALCGVAPDFDFVALIGGEWNELVHHRGVSHSLVALTVVAPILGALARRWPGQKQGSSLDWIHLTWWALITHPLLDTCTSYGTQLLAPLSDHRFAIDAVSIVDLAYTIPLLLAVLRARWGKDRRRSARFAAAMLALTTAYLGAGFVQSQRAIAWAEEELAAEGFASVETRALPTLGNLLVFRALARDGEGRYRVAILSLSAPRTPRWYAVRDDEDPLVAAARETERGRLFEWFAMRFSPAELVHEDHGFVVRVSDLRYGSMRDPRLSMWGADARFGLEGHLLEWTRWNRRGELDMQAELATLWAHVVGDDAKIAEEMVRAGPERRGRGVQGRRPADLGAHARRADLPGDGDDRPLLRSRARPLPARRVAPLREPRLRLLGPARARRQPARDREDHADDVTISRARAFACGPCRAPRGGGTW